MKATLIFRQRLVWPDGALAEMRVWQLPTVSRERPHGLKYSLYYGRNGERIIGYDNERGKGDHRHRRSSEDSYGFVSVEQMIDDFLAEIRAERDE